MKRTLPPGMRRRLLKALNARSEDEADADELSSVLLQISLAVMLIFMIAFFLFIGKVGGEIDRLEELEIRISEAEREKILHAIDQVAERYRIQYGLKEFLRIDPVSGDKIYEFAGVIDEGALAGGGYAVRAFRAGSMAARRDYASPLFLENQWVNLVNELAGDAARNDPAFVTLTVRDRIAQLKREVIEIQTLAAADVQEYLAQRPELVRDPEIRALLVRINTEPDSPDRNARLTELNTRLRRYVYDLLGAQSGVPMLEEP